MVVSPDDIEVIFLDERHRSQLFGVPDLVAQHLIRFTPLVPYVHRIEVRDPAVEKADYIYRLMVSLLPIQLDHDETMMPLVTYPKPLQFGPYSPPTAAAATTATTATANSATVHEVALVQQLGDNEEVDKATSEMLKVLEVGRVPDAPTVRKEAVIPAGIMAALPVASPTAMMGSLMESFRYWLDRK